MIEDMLTYQAGTSLSDPFGDLLAADLDDDARACYERTASDIAVVAAGADQPLASVRAMRTLLAAMAAAPALRSFATITSTGSAISAPRAWASATGLGSTASAVADSNKSERKECLRHAQRGAGGETSLSADCVWF